MSLQVVGLDVAGFTAFRCADVRTVIVMNHYVTGQFRPLLEGIPAPRDLTLERPFACMNSLVLSEITRA